jgi:hypothetical protein
MVLYPLVILELIIDLMIQEKQCIIIQLLITQATVIV